MRSLVWAPVLIAWTGVASAQDAVTYSYDALGRLVLTTNTIGANSGTQVINDYDSAGNRSRQRVTSATTTNHSPIANADTVGVTCGHWTTVDVVANDTDSDGDTLSVVSIVKISGPGSASIDNSTTVTVYAGSSSGETSVYDYVIQDGRGGSATGRLTAQTVGSPMLCA